MTQARRLVPASTIERRLDSLREHASAADLERLRAIVARFPPAGDRLPMSDALDVVAPGKQEQLQLADLRAFRQRVANVGQQAGLELLLEVDSKKGSEPSQRGCWFTLPGVEAAERELADYSRTVIDVNGHEPMVPARGRVLHPRPVAVVVLHSNERLAEKLADALDAELRSDRRYQYNLWHSSQVAAGEDSTKVHAERISNADVVLDLLSPVRLVALKKDQVPSERRRRDEAGACRDFFIPVLLEPISDERHDLGIYENKRLVALHGATGRKSFAECHTRARKDEFVHAIAATLDGHLGSELGPVDDPNRAPASISPEDAARLLDAAGHQHDSQHFIAPRGAAATFRDELSDAAPTDPARGGVDMLAELLAWSKDPKAPPYAAIVGEFGIGKTTLLREWTRRQLSERGRDATLPLPIFVDLRHYSETLHQGRMPSDIESFLQELLDKVWRRTEHAVSAKEVLRLVREEGAILIFDGLDEKLVHLDEAQGQAFIRLLWQALPPAAQRKKLATGARSGRLVLSCRSHYFKTLRAQRALFLGEGREGLRAEDYCAWAMLPFGEDQIRDYLGRCLGEERVEPTLALFRAVNNLRELAERPYLLALMTQHIDALEARRLSGTPVRGATVYELVTEQWLARDNAKHQIRPEDKLQLMEDIAAALWHDGAREWEWSRVRTWLLGRIAEDSILSANYRALKPDRLEQDFRSATFVLRPNSSEKSFRFAHTSLQEYFLARYLLRCLCEPTELPSPAPGWALRRPSRETFEFLGQLLDIASLQRRERCLAALEQLLAVASEQATDNAFHYWLVAAERALPEPAPSRLALARLSLRGEQVCGASAERPLNLAGADLTGADLSHCRFRDVDLGAADLTGAQLTCAELLRVNTSQAIVAQASFVGATLRHCSVEGWRGGESADFYECHLVAAGVDAAELPARFELEGTLSEPEAPQPAAPGVRGECIISGGHSGPVKACAFSPDGAWLASGSTDGTLRLWDTRAGRQLRTFRGHESSVQTCVFSSDGALLLSGSDDRTLKLWNPRTAECLLTLSGHDGAIWACAFSPDGTWLLSGSGDGAIRIWDAKTGLCRRELSAPHPSAVRACAISPDGALILSGALDETLQLWDVATDRALHTLRGHSNYVMACTFSPDSSLILSGSLDQTLRVWNTRSGRFTRTLAGHAGAVRACAVSPDGSRFVSGSDDKTLKLWDASTGRCQGTLHGHAAAVNACAFSPDGKLIVSGSDDKTLKLWDVSSGRCLCTRSEQPSATHTCAISPDGSMFVSAANELSPKIWDGRSGRYLRALEGHTRPVQVSAFSPDGSTIVTGSADRLLQLWSSSSGRLLRTLKGHTGAIQACAFSSDGQKLASGSDDKTLRIWDVELGECSHTLHGHRGPVYACAFSPKGTRLLSSSGDETLRLWDIASGTSKYVERWPGYVHACAFSPNGKLMLSGHADGTLKLWETDRRRSLHTWLAHKGPIHVCAFSPDGSLLLSASDDRTISLWDDRGRRCQTFSGHLDAVRACTFTADGSLLLSGSMDGTLRLWRRATGEVLLNIVRSEEREYAAIDANGRVIATSENAWRFLHHAIVDPSSGRLRTLPAEHYGPLPIAPLLSGRMPG